MQYFIVQVCGHDLKGVLFLLYGRDGDKHRKSTIVVHEQGEILKILKII